MGIGLLLNGRTRAGVCNILIVSVPLYIITLVVMGRRLRHRHSAGIVTSLSNMSGFHRSFICRVLPLFQQFVIAFRTWREFAQLD